MNDYIAHYGVKGQKWGVRKSQVKASAKRKKKYADTAIDVVNKSTTFKGAKTVASGASVVKAFVDMGTLAGTAVAGLNIGTVALGSSAVAGALPVIGAVGIAGLATTGAIVGGRAIYKHLENKDGR